MSDGVNPEMQCGLERAVLTAVLVSGYCPAAWPSTRLQPIMSQSQSNNDTDWFLLRSPVVAQAVVAGV